MTHARHSLNKSRSVLPTSRANPVIPETGATARWFVQSAVMTTTTRNASKRPSGRGLHVNPEVNAVQAATKVSGKDQCARLSGRNSSK